MSTYYIISTLPLLQLLPCPPLTLKFKTLFSVITLTHIVILCIYYIDMHICIYPTNLFGVSPMYVGTLVRVSTAVMKHHDQKQLGEERIYFTLQLSSHTSSLTKVRAIIEGRNLRPELVQRPWKSMAFWPAPQGLFSLPSVIREEGASVEEMLT